MPQRERTVARVMPSMGASVGVFHSSPYENLSAGVGAGVGDGSLAVWQLAQDRKMTKLVIPKKRKKKSRRIGFPYARNGPGAVPCRCNKLIKPLGMGVQLAFGTVFGAQVEK